MSRMSRSCLGVGELPGRLFPAFKIACTASHERRKFMHRRHLPGGSEPAQAQIAASTISMRVTRQENNMLRTEAVARTAELCRPLPHGALRQLR